MFLHFFKRLQPGQITAHSGTDPNIRTDPVDYNFLMTSEETEIQANLRGELCQTTTGEESEGPVIRCNFSCNLQRNSTLKRCKFVTNVWYVKNVLANCNGTCICQYYISQECNCIASWKKNCTV